MSVDQFDQVSSVETRARTNKIPSFVKHIANLVTIMNLVCEGEFKIYHVVHHIE